MGRRTAEGCGFGVDCRAANTSRLRIAAEHKRARAFRDDCRDVIDVSEDATRRGLEPRRFLETARRPRTPLLAVPLATVSSAALGRGPSRRPPLRSFLAPRDMADAPDSAPAADTGRQKKCVLVPFGGKSQLDANRRLFEWCAVHLMDAADDVFVFHHTRRRKSGDGGSESGDDAAHGRLRREHDTARRPRRGLDKGSRRGRRDERRGRRLRGHRVAPRRRRRRDAQAPRRGSVRPRRRVRGRPGRGLRPA